MSSTRQFLDYVRHGADKPFVSLQIGAGAGFDAKLAGKEWVSEATIEDTVRAYEIVGGEPLYNIGLPIGDFAPELRWQPVDRVRTDERRSWAQYLDTPHGQLSWEFVELKRKGCTPTKYPLGPDDSLDVVRWHAEMIERNLSRVQEALAPQIAKIHEHGPVSVQWALQPFEILGLANAVDAAVLLMGETEEYRILCDQIREVNIALMREVYAAGADFVFLGGPGSEVASPKIYEEFLIPDSRIITDAAHAMGGLIYTHICSPVEPFLSRGYYNRMGLDLFETLSPPPVGNVADLAKTRRDILPPEVCTRGNIGLDLMVTGTVDQVVSKTIEILEATKGFKHMVAASDYLFYDVPLENAKAVVETVQQFKG